MNKNNSTSLVISVAAMIIAGSVWLMKSDQAMPIQNDASNELKLVQEEFTKIDSKEDKELIHKLFSGGAEYLLKCETMVNTSQFDPILGRVQSSYGWERDKYSDFTDAVSDYLVGVGYDIPKDLKTSQERKDFAKIFKDLALSLIHI